MDRDTDPDFDDLLAHAGWLSRLATRLVRDPARAEDLVQETWFAALRRPPARGTPARPWLARVLRNFARQDDRSRDRRDARELGAARGESLPAADELVARVQRQRDLVAAVLELPETLRTVVLLHHFEGLSAAEIARRTKRPASTVRTQLEVAHERLRAMLDRRYGDRETWCALLAPLASGAPALPLVPLAAAVLAIVAATAVAYGPGSARDHGLVELARGLDSGRGGSPDVTGALAELAEPRDGADSLPRAAALGLHGLVHDENGVGIAGWSVKLWSLGSPSIEAESDPLGRFSLPLPPDDGWSVRLVVRAGWRVDEPELELGSRSSAAKRGPISFTAVRAPRAPFRGRVVDRRTGEPVPGWPVRVVSRTASEAIVSDEEGALASDTLFEAGPLEVVDESNEGIPSRRRDRQAVEHAADGASAPFRFAVDAGPTFRVRLTGSEGIAPESCVASLDASPAIAGGHPMRAGDPAWVRCAPWVYAHEGPWRLYVATRSGSHAGSALVPAVQGIARDVIEVELRACGRIVGRIEDAAGEAVANARVAAEALSAAKAPEQEEPSATAITNPLGWFEIAGLEGGGYRLVVDPARFERAERFVSVAPGEATRQDLVLGGERPSGAIRIRLTTASGRKPVDFTFGELRGERERIGFGAFWKQVGGVAVAEIEESDLSAGEYEVVPQPIGVLLWSPQPCIARPGGATVELVLQDRDEPLALRLSAVERASGREVEAGWWSASIAGGGRVGGKLDAGVADLRLPASGEFELRVGAEGFRTVFAAREAVLSSVDGGSLRVELSRGWAARISVVDRTERPLAGVAVLLDGRMAGTTGEDGDLALACAREPERVALVRTGWAVFGGDVDPSSGRFHERYGYEIRATMWPRR